MKTLIFSLLLLTSVNMYGQITKREIPSEPTQTIRYDSLENMSATKIRSYIGQEIIVLENNGFYTAPDGSDETEASIIEKSFTITDIAKSEKYFNKINFTLTGKDGQTIYYRLSSRDIEQTPFIITGFFAKQRQLYKGKKLRLKCNYESIELKSGLTKTFLENEQFTCTDALYIVDKSKRIIPSLILQNEKQEEINVPMKGLEVVMGYNIDRFSIK